MEVSQNFAFSVAEARLAELQKEHRIRKSREVDPACAKMTFGAAANLHLQRLVENVTLKRRTRAYWRETLTALFKNRPNRRDSQNCADLAQGLVFTGCRIAEAAQVEWRDLNFEAGEILVKGDPEEGTKNGEIRRVPMIPQARALFEKMMTSRADEPSTTKVFIVHECQKSMDRAAKKIGMTRITHHDLRHFLPTFQSKAAWTFQLSPAAGVQLKVEPPQGDPTQQKPAGRGVHPTLAAPSPSTPPDHLGRGGH